MSFKREGDDKSLLNNLRRRRIRDLFAEDIPKDEAKLLCNGKYACLVCGYKPVFDTVDMLTVHRKGKKHCAYEAQFLQKKKELADLVRKRHHEQYLKTGTTHIQQAQSTVLLGISSTQPYDPRVKRHKLKPYDRKPRVELNNSSLQELQGPDLAMQLTPPGVNLMQHSHQLKNIFKQPQPQEQPPAQPYLKKRKQQFDSTASEEKQNIPNCTKQPFNTDNNFSQLLPKVCAENEMFGGLRDSRNVGINSFKCAHILNAEKVPASYFVNGGGCHTGKIRNSPKLLNFVSNSGISSDTVTHSSNIPSDFMSDIGNNIHNPGIITNSPLPSNFVNNSVNVHGAGACVQSGTGVGRSKPDISSQDKKNRAEKFLSLRGSGWKRDWDGKWIRDEDAEFDSDEEPPDLQ